MLHIGQLIRKKRDEVGLTRDELADRVDVSQSTLAKIEYGSIENPGFYTIASLLEALNVSFDQLGDFMSASSQKGSDSFTEPKKPAEFVYFDLHGVLLAGAERQITLLARAMECDPLKVEEVFWRHDAQAVAGQLTRPQLVQALARDLDRSLSVEQYDQTYLQACFSYKPGVQLLQSCIDQRRDCGIITNIQPGSRQLLQQAELLPAWIFELTWVESCAVGVVKPESAIYKHATRIADVPVDTITFTDDSLANCYSAQSFGWQAVPFSQFSSDQDVPELDSLLFASS